MYICISLSRVYRRNMASFNWLVTLIEILYSHSHLIDVYIWDPMDFVKCCKFYLTLNVTSFPKNLSTKFNCNARSSQIFTVIAVFIRNWFSQILSWPFLRNLQHDTVFLPYVPIILVAFSWQTSLTKIPLHTTRYFSYCKMNIVVSISMMITLINWNQ